MNALLQFFNRNRNRLWTIGLLLVSTFFIAKTINTVIAYRYFPVNLPESRETPATRPVPGPTRVDIPAILSRNIFNSEASSPEPVVPRVEPSSEIVPSTLPLELLGTIVFRNSKYSVALIRDRKSRKVTYYGTGEKVLNARVVKIERFNIILENKGRLERLEVQAAKSKLPAPHQGRPTSTGVSRPSSGTSEDVEFEEIGPGRFEVPQTYVDNVLKDFSKILTQARMVPNLVNGRTEGFKVFQIKKDSIFEKLGLKNQDVIMQVNGMELDGIEKATGLFTALRNEKSISIDIVRNGSRLNYTYEIR